MRMGSLGGYGPEVEGDEPGMNLDREALIVGLIKDF